MIERGFDKILVIKLGALGDFIQALGPMAAIRRYHPQARITLLTTKAFTGFAEQSGYFDDIWVDQRPKWFHFSGWRALKQRFNEGGFDRVYDLQNNDRTAWYFKLFTTKPEWVGTAKGASHRNTSPQRTAGHAFDGHVQTLALAGIKDIQVDDLRWVKTEKEKFHLPSQYAVIVPGCAPSRPEKQWPAACYGELAKWLIEKGVTPVILGAQAEKGQAKKIKDICPDALDLVAQTSLFDIATLGRGAVMAIGNDTGPMHIIAATGCPSLVLFSSHSKPARHCPQGKNVSFLQKDNLADLSVQEVCNEINLGAATDIRQAF